MNVITLNAKGTLSDLDWVVVNVARRDGLRSLRSEGSLVRLVLDFFIGPVARPLANERLEALRRFCVCAWHRDLIRARDVRPIIDAGYSSVDVFKILAHVAGFRGFIPSLQEGAI